MMQFLLETLQLGYWAFCCPARLQARMNAWTPRPEQAGRRPDTRAFDILLNHAHSRFVAQFLLLVLLFTLPLLLLIVRQGAWQEGWLPVIALVCAYGLGVVALAPGLSLPLFLTLAYLIQPTFFSAALTAALTALPPYRQLSVGLGMGGVLLIVNTLIGYRFLLQQQVNTARLFLVIGSGLAGGGGSWLATQSWLMTLLLSGTVLLMTGWFSLKVNTADDAVDVAFVVAISIAVDVAFVVASVVVGDMAGVMAGVVAGVVAGVIAFVVAVIVASGVVGVVANVMVGVVAGVIAFGVMGVMMGVVIGVAAFVVAFVRAVVVTGGVLGGIAVVMLGVVASVVVGVVVGIVVGVLAALATAPLAYWLAAGWLLGLLISPIRWRWVGLIAGGIMVALGFNSLGFLALWAVPAVLVSYYRLFPFQVGWAAVTAGTHAVLAAQRIIDPIARLERLPPYQDELLRWALPGHAALVAAAMRQDPARAIVIWQQLQASPMAGFQHTAQHALPQIVAHQAAAITTVSDLLQINRASHPYLPRLVPALYEQRVGEHGGATELRRTQPEISSVLPGLLIIAGDVRAALDATNIALRERGLEWALAQLALLQGQLPGKGVTHIGLTRWQPVFAQWTAILQVELAHQRTLGQGELINPYQYGNPLRPNRADLFKGRNQLAEEIVRLVLDYSRPTLVLHGPRRMGKSSFLLNLPRLLPSEILPIYLDIQDAAATNSEGDFCYSLARAMRNDSRIQGISLPAPNRADFRSDPYPALQDWLDEALPLLGERRLLLNLDEFEKLGQAMSAGRLSTRLFDQLRHLIQHDERLGFLFAGMQTLEELGPNWSSYFISVVPLKLLYLERPDAVALLTAPDPAFQLRYAEGLVDQMVDLTRGQPYLLQLLGANLVKQANAIHTQMATAALLDAAIQSAFDEAQAYFTELWKLYLEFTGEPPAEVMGGRRLLLAAATAEPLPLNDDEATTRALYRLTRYHILEQVDGSYRVEVPLVARWVRERARLDAGLYE
ncbi:MAG: hypothetical protein R3C14_00090 [Caldilineaceae bacterium]